ncbi:MAG: hypothetical protein A2Z97_09625 [Bdellovibrionales bacterium GWB1_52_6]|nr:MAG: hypothetical protein A2Z97_09625 [Bdellovibrionales bacterium GWB1_52_6]
MAWMLILSSAFLVIFLVVSGALFLSDMPGSGTRDGSLLMGKGAVGLIEVNGVIIDSKKTLARLEDFEENSKIKAVVLRLNSPGGAVAPSQEIYEAVKAYKKPVVVSMGSVAASGAYYISCGAKKVYANPGSLTASIGVIMEFVNFEKLYEWAKVRRYALKTGKYKGTGAEYREMTPEERELLQTMIDDVLGQFKKAVMDGRKLSAAQVDRIADGRIMSGAQAKTAKLVDELGTLHDAINEAGRLANIKGKPLVIKPDEGRHRWIERFLNDGEDADARSDQRLGGVLQELARLLFGSSSEGLNIRSNATDVAPGIYWLWSGAR